MICWSRRRYFADRTLHHGMISTTHWAAVRRRFDMGLAVSPLADGASQDVQA